MKYKSKVLISVLLVLVLAIGVCWVPASSFTNDVVTSTNDMILINMDTNTVVYSKNADNKWFSGYLVTLTDYLVAVDNIAMPDKATFHVEQEFIDSLSHSDGCLNPYVGKTLTAKDLMGIMLLSTGNDAAYALMQLTGLTVDDFVAEMNLKAAELGCTGTHFVSPGYSTERIQNTTCRDLYKIYSAVRETELFSELTKQNSYLPDGLDAETYTTKSNASILNPDSPYYFRYTNDAVYSYTKETYECLVLTTTYHEKTYFFAGLLGKNQSEQNVSADAKKLAVWAYLNLEDYKVIDSESGLAPVEIKTSWGSYKIELHPFDSAYKTLPKDYDPSLLSYSIDVKDEYQWPMFKGDAFGKATVTYDNEEIENVKLVVDSNEGVDMLSDSARFGVYVLDRLIPQKHTISQPANSGTKETVPPTQATANTQTEPTESTAVTEQGTEVTP